MAVSNKDYVLAMYYMNREEKIAYQKEYNKKNKKTYDEYQREYYQKNKEYIRSKINAQRQLERILYPKEKKQKAPKPQKVSKSKPVPDENNSEAEKSDAENSEAEKSEKIPKKYKYDKYYSKKLLQKAQHSLPEPVPFSDFRLTNQGYTLDFK